ncbi:MAG: hypothetical protein KDK41_15585 [Leptospiraceae bacterium]|nr:hypothetical protein [Leptospiraceae bacterium]
MKNSAKTENKILSLACWMIPATLILNVAGLVSFTEPRENIFSYLSIILFATSFWFILLLFFERRQAACFGTLLSNQKEITFANSISPQGVWLLFALSMTGLVCRLILLPNEPALSDDVWRYAWDGHITNAGVNPYLFAPNDSALETLRTDWFHRITFQNVRTVYPPLAQGILALANQISPGYLGIKILFLLIEITVFITLYFLGRHFFSAYLMYYWLNPIIIFLNGSEAHLDLTVIPLLVPLILAFQNDYADQNNSTQRIWQDHRFTISAVCLSLAALIKPYYAIGFSIFFTPPENKFTKISFLRKWSSLLIVPLIIGAFIFPYRTDLWKLLESPLMYSNFWQFNSPVYSVLSRVMPEKAVRIFCYGFVAILSIYFNVRSVTIKKREYFAIEHRLAYTFTIPFLFLPTIYPWYFLPGFFLAALTRDLNLLFLSVVLPLSYLSWNFEQWQLPGWVLSLEFIPLIIFWLLRSRQRNLDAMFK